MFRERALAQLDIEQLKRRNVAAEVFLQAGPEMFVREFVVAWLRAHGVRIVADSPEIKVKAFASVFGTDTDTTLIGIRAFQAPVVNLPIPEIALFMISPAFRRVAQGQRSGRAAAQRRRG